MKQWLSDKFKKRWVKLLGLGLVVIIIISIVSVKNGNQLELIEVKRGRIIQDVQVTGKAKSIDQVDLAFDKGGRVSQIFVKIGDKVMAHESLISLDTDELRAQLLEAQANVEVQLSKLEELKTGTRLEDIKIKETELAKENQELVNEYQGVVDVLSEAYSQTDNAIRKQLDPLFSSDEELSPQLTFSLSNSQVEIDIEAKRFGISKVLGEWRTKLDVLGEAPPPPDLDLALKSAKSYLSEVRSFLNLASQAINISVNLGQTTIDTYRTNVNTALTNLNQELTDVSDKEQTIASQKLVVQKVQDELDLKRAGAVKEQIAAQEAQVKQVRAKAALFESQISKSTLYAPFAGVVARQDAKRGEIVAANAEFLTLISEDQFEVEANVPEVDVGKLALGNRATITFDAFQNENFAGNLYNIEPAETVISGVVNFKIKVALESPDPRLKSGLTANLEIRTFEKPDVLVLPIFAVYENETGSKVETRSGRKTFEKPVTLGVKGTDGMVEVISGVSEGEQVVVNLKKN